MRQLPFLALAPSTIVVCAVAFNRSSEQQLGDGLIPLRLALVQTRLTTPLSDGRVAELAPATVSAG